MRFAKLAIITTLGILFITQVACSATPSTPASPEKTSVPQLPAVNGEDWQKEWDKNIREAKKEGIVVIYAAYGVAQVREPFLRAFKEKFGFPLEMTVARGPELTAKLVNERRAGLFIADVYMGGATSIANEMVPKGMLDPIEPHLILSEVKNPGLWFGGYLPIWDSQRTAAASLANITSRMAINTSLIQPQELTSYKDLLQTKFKGLIVMNDPTSAGGGLSWFSMSRQLMGVDYIKNLVKQDLMITRDLRLMSEWLARGKYAIGIAVDSGGIRALIKDGAPLYMLSPFKEGIDLGMGGGNMAVMSNSPHPYSTNVFINWGLSREGQTILSKALGMASRRIDVPTDHLEPWMVPDPSFKYIIESEEDIINEYKKIELARELFAPVLK